MSAFPRLPSAPPASRPPLRGRISTRLSLAIVALLTLWVGGSAHLLDRHLQLQSAIEVLATRDFQRTGLVSEINEHANDAARKLMLLLDAPPGQRDGALEEIGAANRRLDSALVLLAGLVEHGRADPALRTVDATLVDYRRAFDGVVRSVREDRFDAAREQLMRTTDLELSMLISALQTMDRTQQHAVEQRLGGLRASMQSDRRLLLGLTLAGAVSGLAVALWLVRGVVAPLSQAAQMARRFSRGDYAGRLRQTHRRDEVGEMARALNQLADAVSEREERLRRLVDVDALTGLPQRGRFVADSEPAVAQAVASGAPVLLVCFDIDRLKSINALLGFRAGDHVILTAAQRLLHAVGADGHVGRVAGGSFAALLPLHPRDADPRGAALALQHALEARLVWERQPLDLSLTAGYVVGPAQGDGAERLLRRAEQALHEGKRLRGRVTAFEDRLDALRLSHLSLLSELQQALDDGSIVAFVQPKLCLRSGRVDAVEALVRWRHPQRGWISPGEFIPFAENTGRISALTDRMLRQGVELAARSARAGRPLTVAVNLSTQDLRDRTLAGRVAALLDAHALPPRHLELEITESGLLDAGADPVAQLHALRELGVGLAIDDFGTGQSSLAYLQRLPAQELKIDRSFIAGADLQPRRRALLTSIVQLGHGLGLTVTGEGVETAGELAMLVEAGCDYAQGYHIARPMPAAELAAWRRGREEAVDAAAATAGA